MRHFQHVMDWNRRPWMINNFKWLLRPNPRSQTTPKRPWLIYWARLFGVEKKWFRIWSLKAMNRFADCCLWKYVFVVFFPDSQNVSVSSSLDNNGKHSQKALQISCLFIFSYFPQKIRSQHIHFHSGNTYLLFPCLKILVRRRLG